MVEAVPISVATQRTLWQAVLSVRLATVTRHEVKSLLEAITVSSSLAAAFILQQFLLDILTSPTD